MIMNGGLVSCLPDFRLFTTVITVCHVSLECSLWSVPWGYENSSEYLVILVGIPVSIWLPLFPPSLLVPPFQTAFFFMANFL